MIYVKRFEDLFLFLFLNDREFVLPVLVPPKYGLKEFFSKPEPLRHLFHMRKVQKMLELMQDAIRCYTR